MVKAARDLINHQYFSGKFERTSHFFCAITRIDARFVILNEVKNPLKADKRQRTQRIANEEILRVAQDDKQYGERDCPVGHASSQ